MRVLQNYSTILTEILLVRDRTLLYIYAIVIHIKVNKVLGSTIKQMHGNDLDNPCILALRTPMQILLGVDYCQVHKGLTIGSYVLPRSPII